MSKKTLSVLCPTCQVKVIWENSQTNKPFCSERCKLIDLGEWASEKHKIIGNVIDNESDEFNFFH